MNRRAFQLPPLELLVAFEAAARYLSFTRAADEIALTQSAVSRQIQALEARLGVTLFRRLHRALALTDDGRAFFQATAAALADLDRATRALQRAGELKTVVVTTTAGFAGLWLIPRLSTFVAAHPGVDVRISAGNSLVNLERDGVDVAVRYQAVDDSGHADRLFGETVSPVCSPRLRRDPKAPLRLPADLARHTLLRMESDGKNQLQDWGLWLHAMKLADLRPAGVMHFSSYDQLIHAAVAGQGVALGRLPLIDQLMKARKLVAPFADAVVSPRGYAIVVAAQSAHRPEVAGFVAWLKAQSASDRGPADGAPADAGDRTARRRAVTARGPGSARPRGRARA